MSSVVNYEDLYAEFVQLTSSSSTMSSTSSPAQSPSSTQYPPPPYNAESLSPVSIPSPCNSPPGTGIRPCVIMQDLRGPARSQRQPGELLRLLMNAPCESNPPGQQPQSQSANQNQSNNNEDNGNNIQNLQHQHQLHQAWLAHQHNHNHHYDQGPNHHQFQPPPAPVSSQALPVIVSQPQCHQPPAALAPMMPPNRVLTLDTRVNPFEYPGGIEVLWKEVPGYCKGLICPRDVPDPARLRGYFTVAELLVLKRTLIVRYNADHPYCQIPVTHPPLEPCSLAPLPKRPKVSLPSSTGVGVGGALKEAMSVLDDQNLVCNNCKQLNAATME